MNGNYTLPFDEFINFHQIGPKTAALLMYSAFDILCTVPVDIHVSNMASQLGWINGIDNDEISWQLKQYVPSSMYIDINDACGAIIHEKVKNVLKNV